ncbi:MAG: type II toxin-antitoxin system HicA family toxin [Clostridia bacterium]|jgi:predicted RNA binding protein YcfA (HicA-like mRNA interferase family)|nr:type II toxin-antitoxin system HicA family toxin [Clostridia bacterium]MDD4146215.1 type II toxin-antitoxin system HicA family toxin [Clostridia bacterium]MDD4665770.1 type II toxin-antitoxin system HicA family toxin [Clostridia bacterium]
MKFREIEKIIKEDGWQYLYTKGSHRYYIHPTKPGKITIPYHPGKDLKTKTANSILKQAGLK